MPEIKPDMKVFTLKKGAVIHLHYGIPVKLLEDVTITTTVANYSFMTERPESRFPIEEKPEI